MRFIIATGGTGGHVYPALALAQYMKQEDPDVEILFIGTTNRMEASLVPKLGYAYKGLYVKGMSGNLLQKGLSGCIFVTSVLKAYVIIKKWKPDMVIGFGGYPSASAIEAAHLQGIKTLIHEQNSLIGLTNRMLIKRVDAIVCCYQKALQNFPKDKTYLYGNPRASIAFKQRAKDIYEKYPLDKNKKLVVIVMGSLGSETINQKMIEAIQLLANKPYQTLYVTGKEHYETMQELLGGKRGNVYLVPYIDDMLSVMAHTDIMVSRAGASTIAEITAMGLPSILIPSPHVAGNHQEYNARELVDQQAALMILEKELEATSFVDTIDDMITNDLMIESMKKQAKLISKPNALSDIYALIKRMLGA